MSNMEISPEDRERLAKSKFQEWADEWHGASKEARKAEFLEWVDEIRKAAPPGQPAQPPAPSGERPPATTRHRKRNLFEIALTDTFGF